MNPLSKGLNISSVIVYGKKGPLMEFETYDEAMDWLSQLHIDIRKTLTIHETVN